MRWSVASYNLLAACHLRPERYPGPPAEALENGRRQACLADQIAALGASFLCLQEVDPECFTGLSSRLEPLGYEGFLDLRRGAAAEGCAFFAKSEGGQVVKRHRLDFADPPETEGASRRLAQIIELEIDDLRFALTNTHLQWDSPDRPAACHRGVGQARQLVEAIDRIIGTAGSSIVCGDLNAGYDSAVLRVFFEAGYLAVRSPESAQPTCRANGRLSEIDFVLCRGFLEAAPWPRTALNETIPMPGRDHPSDHIPVGATVTAS